MLNGSAEPLLINDEQPRNKVNAITNINNNRSDIQPDISLRIISVKGKQATYVPSHPSNKSNEQGILKKKTLLQIATWPGPQRNGGTGRRRWME